MCRRFFAPVFRQRYHLGVRAATATAEICGAGDFASFRPRADVGFGGDCGPTGNVGQAPIPHL
jgi:hypothetical protein